MSFNTRDDVNTVIANAQKSFEGEAFNADRKAAQLKRSYEIEKARQSDPNDAAARGMVAAARAGWDAARSEAARWRRRAETASQGFLEMSQELAMDLDFQREYQPLIAAANAAGRSRWVDESDLASNDDDDDCDCE
jgi:hypothetical protein